LVNENAQLAVDKMVCCYKALDNDIRWAQCLLNDQFTNGQVDKQNTKIEIE
jgi:hypothetical protein